MDQFQFEKKVRWDATFEELPAYQVDNEYVKTGYRVNYHSAWDVFMSSFKCHNETFNIWSHLIGALVSLILLIVYLNTYPNMESVGSFGTTNELKILSNHQEDSQVYLTEKFDQINMDLKTTEKLLIDAYIRDSDNHQLDYDQKSHS